MDISQAYVWYYLPRFLQLSSLLKQQKIHRCQSIIKIPHIRCNQHTLHFPRIARGATQILRAALQPDYPAFGIQVGWFLYVQ